MKQILQHLGSGETILADIPCPSPREGHWLLESRASLVSLGTERMLVEFGRSGWLAKARQQPEKVKQVLQKVKTDGFAATIGAVRSKLDQPIPLGCSNVGVVVDHGDGRAGSMKIPIGQRMVSNGPHAEMVSVPENLCAAVPEGVSDEAASFTVVGAIGLQGIRLLQPTLGERVVVMGLGLIGLMTVQMLRAHGCRVLGIDLETSKCELAAAFGAVTCDLSRGEDPLAAAVDFTGGIGVDGVLITASSKGHDIMHQAATMCRKRGRIVLVGVVGLQLNRADFYEKELSFQVSCSYGPGRYDPNYERKGLDYPIGFVRWTEKRNMEAVLELLADGSLDVSPLISHRFYFAEALKAYEAVCNVNALGIVLDYTGRNNDGRNVSDPGSLRLGTEKRERSVSCRGDGGRRRHSPNAPIIGFIGAGNFATRILLPLLNAHDVRLKSVVSESGVSGTHAGNKFGFERSLSDATEVLDDEEINVVFISTRHETHARYVIAALRAGKHVFVEKPLCIRREEFVEIQACLQDIETTAAHGRPVFMVGFNRRFSPHTERLRHWLRAIPVPKSVIVTVNAGEVPPDHWTLDPEVGGGRVVGEACHFIDLTRHLVGHRITGVESGWLRHGNGRREDCVTVRLGLEDGSMAAIHYLSNGHPAFQKERIEVFGGGRILQCHNFRLTRGYGVSGKVKTHRQDKGHAQAVEAFLAAVRSGGRDPIPVDELLEVTEATFEAAGL